MRLESVIPQLRATGLAAEGDQGHTIHLYEDR